MVELLLETVVSGLIVGTVYALIGLGLTIVYGVLRLVNFAHGDFVVLAGFLAYVLHASFGVGSLAAVPLVAAAMFVLGLVMYYLIVPRLLLSDDPTTASFLAFFGVSMMLQYVLFYVFGATPVAIPFPYAELLPVSTKVGFMYISTGRVLAGLAALVVTVILVWLLFRTAYGKALRAIIQNRDAVRLLGIETDRISAVCFGVGLALAGVAGVLLTLVFPSIAIRMGTDYAVVAFVVVVLGGLSSPLGTLAGGLLYGVAESVTTLYLPAGMAPALAFLVLIIALMVRPEGLLTGATLRRRTRVATGPRPAPSADTQTGRRSHDETF